MRDPVLSFIRVTKEYRLGWGGMRVRALEDFDCELEAGQIVGLLGANGSGKSTALKVAAGLVRPDQGQCRVFGLEPGSAQVSRLVGFQPEKGGICEHLTALESLEYWGGLSGLSSRRAHDRAVEVLAMIDVVGVSARLVRTFSKGMRQRLALGQALLAEPRLLLLDEPFSGLDPIVIRSLSTHLRELADTGTTIVLTSHLLARVEQLCDVVGLMHGGRLLTCDTVEVVLRGAEGQPRNLDDVFIELVGRPQDPGGGENVKKG
jgi:ABC-2 type transport system ATP-binding protein